MNKFTLEESQLLFEVLGKLNLSPLAADAVKTVAMIQSIAAKIQANTEKEVNENAGT